MDDDAGRNDFEELLRAMADEIARSLERVQEAGADDLARLTGVDPERARGWIDEAGRWVRGALEDLGVAGGAAGAGPARRAPRPDGSARARLGETAGAGADPWHAAGPHPLDLPTAEQGAALAALESGRWTIEPGTSALAVRGDGPGPSDALGLVRELRVRDWIDAEGAVTLAGRHALQRWLEAS